MADRNFNKSRQKEEVVGGWGKHMSGKGNPPKVLHVRLSQVPECLSVLPCDCNMKQVQPSILLLGEESC
jgi:hypothetical protein